MTFDEFVNTYNGKAIDYDGGYNVQCVDLAKLFMDKVLGIKIGAIGNAEAYYRRYNEVAKLKNNFDRIPNTPSFVPQKGDIAVWGTKLSKYGHIAICNGEGNTSYFYTYDQNWNGKKMKLVKHNYKGFEGVLRPKNQSNIVAGISINDIFDSDLYFSLYPDLQKALGKNYYALLSHYLNFGIREGRVASYVFNPSYYYSKYPDLQKNIGKNWSLLLTHFLNNGISEGRTASCQFDVNYYKEKNIDVKNAFSNNYDVVKHFINNGIKEFRLSSKEFNVRNYKTNYQDLQKAFGNDSKSYYKHYLIYGQKEKRRA